MTPALIPTKAKKPWDVEGQTFDSILEQFFYAELNSLRLS